MNEIRRYLSTSLYQYYKKVYLLRICQKRNGYPNMIYKRAHQHTHSKKIQFSVYIAKYIIFWGSKSKYISWKKSYRKNLWMCPKFFIHQPLNNQFYRIFFPSASTIIPHWCVMNTYSYSKNYSVIKPYNKKLFNFWSNWIKKIDIFKPKLSWIRNKHALSQYMDSPTHILSDLFLCDPPIRGGIYVSLTCLVYSLFNGISVSFLNY